MLLFLMLRAPAVPWDSEAGVSVDHRFAEARQREITAKLDAARKEREDAEARLAEAQATARRRAEDGADSDRSREQVG